MLHNKTNKDILSELNRRVYGHQEAKKSLISLVNRSKIRHYQKWGELQNDEDLIKPSKCLLVGGSGTGKSHLVRSLAEVVNFPLLVVDASQFNPTGASGGIKAHDLQKFIVQKATEYSQERQGTYFSIEGIIDQMVVFVDEFDKVSSHYEGSSGNWNEHVQTSFLTVFDNHESLSGVSWIFAGAFSGLHKDKAVPRSIGFHAGEPESIINTDISSEDIIKYGLLPEIVGRLTSICQLDQLSEDDYYQILTERLIPVKLTELTYFGVLDHVVPESTLRTIAADATTSAQGVRYMQRELEKYFLDIEFNYENIEYNI